MNRLTTVTNTATSPNVVSKFIYDGDGSRVLQINISGTQVMTTAYAGSIEVQITATQRITKSYYSAGSQLVAMRVITSSGSVLYYLSSDHLGSASLTTDASGGFVARQLYDAWGNVRSGGGLPTDIGYTSQRLDSGTNLLFMHARYYDSYLNRWIQPDTIVPDPKNPQSLNRFSYVNNNPVKYTDPTGHKACEDENGDCSTPPPIIPKCTADYCKGIDPSELAREMAAFKHFLEDPGYFARLWVDPAAWNSSASALYLRRYTENVLHMPADQVLSNGFGSAFGTDFVDLLRQLRQTNTMAAGGMGTEDLESNYPLPLGLAFGVTRLYRAVS